MEKVAQKIAMRVSNLVEYEWVALDPLNWDVELLELLANEVLLLPKKG